MSLSKIFDSFKQGLDRLKSDVIIENPEIKCPYWGHCHEHTNFLMQIGHDLSCEALGCYNCKSEQFKRNYKA